MMPLARRKRLRWVRSTFTAGPPACQVCGRSWDGDQRWFVPAPGQGMCARCWAAGDLTGRQIDPPVIATGAGQDGGVHRAPSTLGAGPQEATVRPTRARGRRWDPTPRSHPHPARSCEGRSFGTTPPMNEALLVIQSGFRNEVVR